MRVILFVANAVNDRTAVMDETVPGRGRRRTYERYVEQREIFATFGKLILERTSGTHRRVSTPPEGLNPLTGEQMRARDLQESRRQLKLIIPHIPLSDLVVVPADSGISDPLAEVIELALRHGRPVLITKLDPPPAIIASSDRFLGRDGVTYVTHGNLRDEHNRRQFRSKIIRFMQSILPNDQEVEAG